MANEKIDINNNGLSTECAFVDAEFVEYGALESSAECTEGVALSANPEPEVEVLQGEILEDTVSVMDHERPIRFLVRHSTGSARIAVCATVEEAKYLVRATEGMLAAAECTIGRLEHGLEAPEMPYIVLVCEVYAYLQRRGL